MKRTPKKKELKEIGNQIAIAEIFGRRVLWIRLGRHKKIIYSTKNNSVGSNVLLYDMKYKKLVKAKDFKDNRRSPKYYYDWGEIDRLIYKYCYEKRKYRIEKGEYVDALDLPDYIIDIRNEIIEMLFNLVKTIIYTHSFHQQINDGDLFQDSVEKLIRLLDDDKHDPLRGTSFTFFTVALKNMIFTQLKKNKRYAISTESIVPPGAEDNYELDQEYDLRDVCDVVSPIDRGYDPIESEFTVVSPEDV
jgi:hypothetical protein